MPLSVGGLSYPLLLGGLLLTGLGNGLVFTAMLVLGTRAFPAPLTAPPADCSRPPSTSPAPLR